jgi:tetratricopeptide (TPR) repeat protein
MPARGLALAAAVCAATVVGAPVAAQQAELRQQQAEIYAQMLRAPDNPELMRAYAQVSLALNDTEAAISTLERALLYQPGDPQLLLEIGAAYFRIGSYPAAQYYLEEAKATGMLGPTAENQADRFLAAIDSRTDPSRIEGFAMIGGTYSTNANLGASDRLLRIQGINFSGAIPESLTNQDDFGIRAVAGVRHDYDLGRANLDTWRTEGSLYAIRFFDEDDGDIESFSVRTGPNLSLDDEAFGAKGRPFVTASLVRQDNQTFYYEYGGGVQLADTFGAEWSAFGELSLVRREYRDESEDFDGPVLQGVVGAAYAPSRGLTLVGSVFFENQAADADPQGSLEMGARLSAIYDYDPNLREAGDLWTLSGFAQYADREFDEPDPAVDPTRTRDDETLRFGVAHRFRFHNGFGAQVDLDTTKRTSNIPNFEFDAFNIAVSLVYEF